MPPSAPSWQFNLAYLLLAAPLVYIVVAGGPYPVPRDLAVKFYVLIGVACGAAVFIVRRRRRDVAGWIGLIAWGGLSIVAVIAALLT